MDTWAPARPFFGSLPRGGGAMGRGARTVNVASVTMQLIDIVPEILVLGQLDEKRETHIVKLLQLAPA